MAKKSFLKKQGLTDIIQKAKQQELKGEEFIREHIIINPDLESLIFPLTDEEFEQLEKNILREGCREPLVLWKNEEEHHVLVDGHNRHRVCRKHNLPFRFIAKDFKDLEEAKDWMINNQLGRRNVTEETKSFLRGLQYKREKKKQGWQTGQAISSSEKRSKGDGKRTVEILAKQHNVSSSTIQRDEKFVDAVDKLTGENLVLRKKVLNKEIKIPKTQLIQLAEEDEVKVGVIGEKLSSGMDWKEAAEENNKSISKKGKAKIEKAQYIKTKIVSSIDKALSKEDESALDEILRQVEELRTILFTK